MTGARLIAAPSLARVRIADDGGEATIIEDAKSSVGIAVSLAGAARGRPVAIDGAHVQIDALAGVDRIHELRADGVEEWLLVAQGKPRGAATWNLRLLGGARGLRLVDDVLEVLDGSGAPRLRAARPFVVDARGNKHPAHYEVDGCAVDRSPAPPWGRAVVAPGEDRCTVRVGWTVDALPEGPLAIDPAWTATGNMLEKRARHIAVQYAPGKVLVAGGSVGSFSSDILSTSEVYDASSGTWAATAQIGKRFLHTAAKISDGVLVVGGYSGSFYELSKRWNSSSGTWTSTPGGPTGQDVQSIALADGTVLATGGRPDGSSPSVSTASVYDPSGTGSWAAVGSMTAARSDHRMALLGTKVLVAGGVSRSTAELYDPVAKTFTATGAMGSVRGEPALAAFSATKAVVLGGDAGTTDLSTAEVYDLTTGAWTPVSGTLPNRVIHHKAALLGSGHVLVAGGYPIWGGGAVFDPTSGAIRETTNMDFGYWNGVTALSDGRVLVSGGWPSGPTEKAYLYAEQPDGAACGAGGDCVSGRCYDAKCCTTCTGTASCTSNEACLSSEWCDMTTTPGKCTAKKTNGATCTNATQCASNYCTDGVCCDTSCGGRCQACSAAKKGSGVDGTCGNVAGGTDPDNECAKGTTACGADGMCDGAGACRVNAPSGTTCGSGACTAGVASGLLCDGMGACITSSVACAPFGCGTSGCKTTCGSDDDCASDAYCTTTGVCASKGSNGKACGAGKECKSGYCADGLCCNTACTGQCEACDVAPNVGSCSPVTGEPHGTKAKCKGPGTPCAGSCDGTNASACAYPSATTACGSTCAAGKETKSACDGAGGCVAGASTNCAPLVCGTDKCLAACANDDECTTGYACKDGACVPRPQAKCSDDGTKSISSAGESACSPYLCNAANGECLRACERSDQCQPGYVCDATNRCVPAPTNAGDTGDSGGCSMSARGSGGAFALLALALAMTGLRRTRNRA